MAFGSPTAYDSNDRALARLLAEWTRTDLPYAARIANLRNGRGLNGSIRLTGSTVINDKIADQITGEADDDWFWAFLLDVTDQSGNEQAN